MFILFYLKIYFGDSKIIYFKFYFAITGFSYYKYILMEFIIYLFSQIKQKTICIVDKLIKVFIINHIIKSSELIRTADVKR